MTENNRKYIAETWIDNGEEEEFKKSFLESLIQQWQGHKKGFDADTVDGMHWEDENNGIKEYIDNAIKNFMTTFKIGLTVFSSENTNDQYYIGFDGIKLYNYDFKEDYLSDDEKKLPWTTVFEEEGEIPSLLEVINQLYERTFIKDDEGNFQSNNDFYFWFLETVEELSSKVNLIDKNIYEGQLNADCVNGIRFFIYNEEQYENLKTLASQYVENGDNSEEVYNAYTMINSLHNIFIIRTKEEIINAGYENGIYPGNPDIATFRYKYEFRVNRTDIINEETGVVEDTIIMLQYREEGTTEWKDITEAKNLIDENKVEEYVFNTIERNPNLVDRILAPHLEDSKNKYITGAFFKNSSGTRKKIPYLNDPDTGHKFLDLDLFSTEVIGKVVKDLEDFKKQVVGENSNGGLIGNINSSIRRLDSAKDDIRGELRDLRSEVTDLHNSIRYIFACFEIVYEWQRIFGWDGISTGEGKTSYWAYANKDFVIFNLEGQMTASTSWTHYGNYPLCDERYRPERPHTFTDMDGKILFRIRDNTGHLEYRSLTGSTVNNHSVWLETMWKARGGTYQKLEDKYF